MDDAPIRPGPAAGPGRPPPAAALVREAERAARAIADEVVAYLGEVHPGPPAGDLERLEGVVRLAVAHASLRWLCGVADWWAREARAGPDGDA